MFWIPVVLLAYLFFAFSALFDRFLLLGPLPSASAYAFTVAAAGGAALFLVPFGFTLLPPTTALIAIIAGLVSIGGFVSLYHAIRISHVSQVIPITGALVPLFTAALVDVWSPGALELTNQHLAAILLLVSGMILLSIQVAGSSRSILPMLPYAILAALLFSVSTVFTKHVYLETTFINGLIWTNFGAFLAVPFLLLRGARTTILNISTWKRRRLLVPLLSAKGIGAAGSLLQQYAIFRIPIGSLPLIHALQGAQYVFLFLFVLALGIRRPSLLKEEITRGTAIFRAIGTASVALGVFYAAM